MSYLIIPVIALVILSAFFSSSEIVYAQANKARLRTQAEEGSAKAKRAQFLQDNYTQVIATILVGNDLVNIAATSMITLLCTRLYFAESANAELYADLIATLILLIFGEIFPKLIAAERANRLALSYSGALKSAMHLFSPIVKLVSAMVDKLAVLWTPREAEPSITDEELALMVDSIQEEGVFTEDEGELIKSAISFRDTTAHDILIPRVEMSAYDIESPLEDLLADADALTYSRLPVYRESIDHIIGILPTKQLMKAALTAENLSEIHVEEMLVEPVFVHMTKSIADILRQFHATKTNMAVVLDEYGGTMGILTIEDILEEIVGEIYDETDEVEEEEFSEITPDTYELDGDVNIYDAFELVEYEPKEFSSEYTTLSGWCTEQLDHFPEAGESFTFEGLTVTVEEVSEHLVEKVRIHVDREPKED